MRRGELSDFLRKFAVQGIESEVFHWPLFCCAFAYENSEMFRKAITGRNYVETNIFEAIRNDHRGDHPRRGGFKWSAQTNHGAGIFEEDAREIRK